MVVKKRKSVWKVGQTKTVMRSIDGVRRKARVKKLDKGGRESIHVIGSKRKTTRKRRK